MGAERKTPMTDARLPDRWLLGPLVRLKPTAFRSYVCALMWSVTNRTDGVIRPEDLAYIPGFDPGDIPELVGADLLAQHPVADWWLITDFKATQTSRAEWESWERRRAWDRDRKAKARGAEKDVSGGKSRGQNCGHLRLGKDRQGQEEKPGTRDDADADYAEDLRDWCAEDQREHLDALADRNVVDGYDR
jgi:hypothetical protein